MGTPISLSINGETRDVPAGNIDELIEALGLPKTTVLVEHNGEALRRGDWTDRKLQSGDRLEILKIAAGG